MAITCPESCCAILKLVIIHDYMDAESVTPALFVPVLSSVYDCAGHSCDYWRTNYSGVVNALVNPTCAVLSPIRK
jgi:hypothetical protein